MSAAFASAGMLLFWTDLPNDDRVRWETEGYDAIALSCGTDDTDCIRQKLDALPPTEKALLIADKASTSAVGRLYAGGLTADRLTGVVLMRAEGVESVPRHALTNVPRLSVFVEKSDTKDQVSSARLFVSTMRRQGVQSSLKFFDPGMMAAQPVHQGVIWGVSHAMGYAPPSELLMKLLTANDLWPGLGHNNRRFLAQEKFLSTHPMDDAVRDFVEQHFQTGPHLTKQWPLETYRAFDLIAYRDAVAPGETFVTLKSRLGQFLSFDLDQYAAYSPQIVVSIDDESNLFQFSWYYWNKLMYSWDSKTPNISAKPLGPFLVFTKPVPDNMKLPPRPRTVLQLKGITFSESDPIGAIDDYSDAVRSIITTKNECIYCHSIGRIGGRAFHLNAYTAQPQGGVAAALEEYSEEVMHNFLFDQEAVAAKLGLSPNPVDAKDAQEFYEWVSGLKTK